MNSKPEEKSNLDDKLGELFEEAYDIDARELTESLNNEEEIYSDFSPYSEGGSKSIELCYNRLTNRKVAMATLRDISDPNLVEVFLREAKLNASLQHPNIVPVYNIGLNDKGPWFTMKFIAGKSLSEYIEDLEKGKTNELSDLNTRLDTFLKVCDAIAYSHSLGVIHLDIKPNNIRISKYGDVLVCDWGLADVEATCCDELLLEYCSILDHDVQNHTLLGTVKGSPGYMAPEQTALLKMRKGFHTDIFSLGTLLYALLTFKAPFKADDLDEVLNKTANCDFPKPSKVNPAIPYSLEAVCLKAMSLKPEERYKDVESLQKEILAYRNGFATNAEEASFFKALNLLYLRHRTLSIVSILAFALLILLTILSVNHINLTKKNALQLAEKMSIEAEYHKKINKDVAPSFFKRANVAFKTHFFDDALNFVSSAVELDDTQKDAWLLKGKLHFINGDFEDAIKSLKKSETNHHALALAERYQNKGQQPSINTYLEILEALNKEKDYEIFGKMVHKIAYSKISLKERIIFCKEVIELRHKHKKRRKPLSFKFNEETGHLDISSNTWLSNILCLQNFPATSINASNSGLYNAVGFKSQTLTSLDISSTNIVELQTLSNKNLKYLNIANCAIPNLTPIYGLPLEIIDIRNTGFRSLSFAKEFKNLREIHIKKDQYSNKQISIIPSHTNVIQH